MRELKKMRAQRKRRRSRSKHYAAGLRMSRHFLLKPRTRSIMRGLRGAQHNRGQLIRHRKYRRPYHVAAVAPISAFSAAPTPQDTFGQRFIERGLEFPGVAPLTFQKSRKVVLKSKAFIAREKLVNIRLKRTRFKRTAQYAEGLTRLYPELISQLLADRLVKGPIAYRDAKGLISSIY